MVLVLRDAAADRALGSKVYLIFNLVLVSAGAIALPSLHSLVARGVTHHIFYGAYVAYSFCLLGGLLGLSQKYDVFNAA